MPSRPSQAGPCSWTSCYADPNESRGSPRRPHRQGPPAEPLFEELKEYLSATDLASLHKIVGEIEERIERFDRRGEPPAR
jgi:hypothetical protein